MKTYLSLIFFIISSVCVAQSYNGPESAEYDAVNSRWLIANTTSHEVIARSSTNVLSVFAGGLGSGPYGIEIVGDTLFCCSGTSIKGYLLSTAAQVFNLNVGATFLNGLTHDNSGNLFATDFTAKKIFKVNINAQTFSAVATSLVQSPNGIVFDAANNRCVFVNWGSSAPIKAMDASTYAVTTILTTTLTNCDGISRDVQGRYYVSNWGAQSVVRYDSAFSSGPITVVTGLSNPADIFYNTLDDTLAIPNAGNNTVTFFGFAPSTGMSEANNIKEVVSIYPNPVTDELRIKNPESRIERVEIYNTSGEKVCNRRCTPGNNTETINVSALAHGIYFVKARVKEGERTSKFVKE